MTTASDVPSTPRTPRAITQPRAETAGKLDRRDALAAMFHALDVNEDGRVDVDECVRAACGVCPTMTEFEVNEWFRSMDVSDTGFRGRGRVRRGDAERHPGHDRGGVRDERAGYHRAHV
jgi:hypothetical protein